MTHTKLIRVSQLLALLELAQALSWPGIYTFPIRILQSLEQSGIRVHYSNPGFQILLGGFDILFVLAPASALFGLLLGKRWGYAGLIVFPLVAILYQVPVIPVVALLIPRARLIWFTAVVVLNIVASISSLWLCVAG